LCSPFAETRKGEEPSFAPTRGKGRTRGFAPYRYARHKTSRADPMFPAPDRRACARGRAARNGTRRCRSCARGGVEHRGRVTGCWSRSREHLESGRDYRSIRAGPRVHPQAARGPGQGPSRPGGATARPTATIIAAISALVLLGVVAVVIVQVLKPRAGRIDARPETTDLQHAYFPTVVAQATFDAPGGAVPPGVESRSASCRFQAGKSGLPPAGPLPPRAGQRDRRRGRGPVRPDPRRTSRFAAEATIRLKPAQRRLDRRVLRLGPTRSRASAPTAPTSGQRAGSWLAGAAHGSRWSLGEDAQQKGRRAPPPSRRRAPRGDGRGRDGPHPHQTATPAVVESNKQSLWHGRAPPAPQTPRRVGVPLPLRAGRPTKGGGPGDGARGEGGEESEVGVLFEV